VEWALGANLGLFCVWRYIENAEDNWQESGNTPLSVGVEAK